MVMGLKMPSWPAIWCILRRVRSLSVSANFTTRLEDAPWRYKQGEQHRPGYYQTWENTPSIIAPWNNLDDKLHLKESMSLCVFRDLYFVWLFCMVVTLLLQVGVAHRSATGQWTFVQWS